MAVLTQTEIEARALLEIQAPGTVNLPFTTGAGGQTESFINDSYQQVWEISGGRIKRVAGATLWTPAPTVAADGKLTSILADVEDVRTIWASATSGSTGDEAADVKLDPVSYGRMQWLRRHGVLVATYSRPKVYCVIGLGTTTPADVNKLVLLVWPGVVGMYFPTEYVPQFTPLNGSTITTPDVNDIESRDIALLAAMTMAPLAGRAELVTSIAMKVSEKTQLALSRKAEAMMSGKQRREV